MCIVYVTIVYNKIVIDSVVLLLLLLILMYLLWLFTNDNVLYFLNLFVSGTSCCHIGAQ